MSDKKYKNTIIACYGGYVTQAIINNLAPILFVVFQDNFNISYDMIGWIISANFITQLIVDAFSAKLCKKFGQRRCIIFAHFMCFLGLAMLGILPFIIGNPYVGIIISVICYAIGGGLIEVLVSPIVEAVPGDEKASAMSLLHSFYCWGQVAVVLLSTAFIVLFSADLWFVLPLVWSVLPLVNAFIFMKVPLAPEIADDKKVPFKKLIRAKGFILIMVLMLCAGASELAMSQWASLFAQKGLGVQKAIGDLLGPCLFAVLMGTGRTIYGFFGHKINLKYAMIFSGVLCVFCYFTVSLVNNPVVALLACSFCGLSVSLMWPGSYSLATKKHPNAGTSMFSVLALCGDLGCSLGPWLTGIISQISRNNGATESAGLKSGLLIAVIFPAIMIITTLMIKNSRRIEK